MVIIAAEFVTGPTKGIFQFLTSFRGRPGEFHLFNFRVPGKGMLPFLDAAAEHGIEVGFLDQNRFEYGAVLKQALGTARDLRINIIQTHGFKPTVIGAYLKLRLGIRWVCFMHGTTSENLKVRAYHLLDSLLQRYADRVVLVTEAQRRLIAGGKDHHRVTVIHNAVDLPEKPHQGNVRQQIHVNLGIAPGDSVVCVVGRLSPEKGVDIFLEAFSSLLLMVPGVHALLVGDGPERVALEARAHALGIQQQVHFTGFQTKSGDYMEASDLVVIPSRSEGIPNVALEAMISARPLVATRVGGVPEVVEHGVNGLMVEPDQPHALAEAMVRVLKDEVLAGSMAKAGYDRARRDFATGSRADKIYEIYRTLLWEASDGQRRDVPGS